MRELYAKIDEILGKINFDSIWSGFFRYEFALYNKESVYLQKETIPYDRRFLGNTSIDYNGKFIAVWHVQNPDKEDPEVLAADMVHEMFHAFQKSRKESRFPSDLKMLNYPENEENYAVKHSEHLLLARACSTEDLNEKKDLLKQFMAARKYRESIIGEIIKQEYLSETIEGLADYAGCMALKQISAKKYEERLEEYAKNLEIFDDRFFNIRQMLYYSGALLCIQLSEAGVEFYHEIGATEVPLFDIVAMDTAGEKPALLVESSKIREYMDKNMQAKRSKFEVFLSQHHDEVQYESYICGYDPMNMIKMDDMLLCSHFVMLRNEKETEPKFLQGPVLVNLKSGSHNQVRSYVN